MSTNASGSSTGTLLHRTAEGCIALLFLLVNQKKVVGSVHQLLNLDNSSKVVGNLELHHQDQNEDCLNNKLSELWVWQRVEERFTAQMEGHLS